jgi:hypothetical protein
MSIKQAVSLSLIDIYKPVFVDKTTSMIETFEKLRESGASHAITCEYLNEVGVVTS